MAPWLRFVSFLAILAFSTTSILGQDTSNEDLQKQIENTQLQIQLKQLQQQLQQLNQSPSATSVAKDQLQSQKDIEELKSSIATSQIARAKTLIGSIDTTNLPKGNADLKSVDLQPTLIGYGALADAISKIPDTSLCSAGDKVVMGPGAVDDLAVLSAYESIVKHDNEILKDYQAKKDFTAQAYVAPAVVFAAIDAAVALSSLFKADVSIEGIDIIPDLHAARFLVAQKFATKCAVLDINDLSWPVKPDSDFLKSVMTLDTYLNKALAIESDLKTNDVPKFTKALSDAKDALTKFESLPKEIADATKKRDAAKTPADKAAFQKTIDDDTTALKKLQAYGESKYEDDRDKASNALNGANAWIATMDGLNSAVSKVLTALFKIDDSGNPYLTRMLRAEYLRDNIKDTKYLTVSVAKLGGNNIIKKWAVHTSIHYSGGAVVEFELKGKDWMTVEHAGQVAAYSYASENPKSLTYVSTP
jgi:hypothetical protein